MTKYVQQSIFETTLEPFKINKPVRLIELFAGIGTQAMAMKRANIEFEHYRVIEFDKYAIQSYNAIHDTNFEPTDIRSIKGSDLGVKRDDYIYFMTYSFPCTDISIAGKLKGMSKGNDTRSGLLWEVERLLNEMDIKPTVLMMENVPQILSKRNIKDFESWMKALEDMGYKNYYKTLNSKDFNVPQNRNRTFMFSFLGDYTYSFPNIVERERDLQDLLEENVDSKYFLTESMVKYILSDNATYTANENQKILNRDVAPTITTREGNTRAALSTTYLSDKFPTNYNAEELTIKIKNCTKQGYLEAMAGDGCYISNIDKKRGTVQKKMTPTIKTSLDVGVVVNEKNDLGIRKLTPKECWRLMGIDDGDFEKASKVVSNTQLYKQAGNAIVVDVMVAMFKQMKG